MTSTTHTLPARLAPVRIGRGRAVHLGCLSSITGDDGSRRYVAAWCGASGSGDNVRAGEAITEPINCRTCLRTQPRSIELINANLTGEAATLPHTGFTVPHTALHVTDLRPMPGTGGTRARLMLGEHLIGFISSSVVFHPIGGSGIDTTDLARYAADCRKPNGQTLNVRDVLAVLVREYEAALRHATPTAEYDHNNECIGCATAGPGNPCRPTCPFTTGTFGPAVILRAAARRLTQHPAKLGYHIPNAILAAAQQLTVSPHWYDLVDAATNALSDHLTDHATPAFKGLTGNDLIRWHGSFSITNTITMHLYAAAARHDGRDFDPEDFANLAH